MMGSIDGADILHKRPVMLADRALTKVFSRAFQRLHRCYLQVSRYNLDLICPVAVRGMIGPSIEPGHAENMHKRCEVDDIVCTVAGRKSAALVHAMSFEMRDIVDACGAATVRDESGRGPVLVSTADERGKLVREAAAPPLHSIGAWKTLPRKGEEHNLSEVQGHMIVGLLLGYPEVDVKAMHTTMCGPVAIDGNISCGDSSTERVCGDVADDFEVALRYIRTNGLSLESLSLGHAPLPR